MSERIGSGLEHRMVFTLGEERYALPLAVVERVVRAVEVTPLPQTPEIVLVHLCAPPMLSNWPPL